MGNPRNSLSDMKTLGKTRSQARKKKTMKKPKEKRRWPVRAEETPTIGAFGISENFNLTFVVLVFFEFQMGAGLPECQHFQILNIQ